MDDLCDVRSKAYICCTAQVGTYNAAVLAARHKIPFIVVAPVSTVDLEVPDGKGSVSSRLICESWAHPCTEFLSNIDLLWKLVS